MAKHIEKDERGAEYAVETGFGTIKKIEWKERNANVEFDVPGLRLGVKGWIDHTDPDVRGLLTEPYCELYEFRIETHREDDLDPAIPIAEVDKFKKFRRMTVFRESKSKPGVPGSSTEVPNEPPPQPGPRANSDQPRPSGIKSGGDMTDTWAYAATVGIAEYAFELLNTAQDAGLIEGLTPASVRDLATKLLTIADEGQRCVRPAGTDRYANSHTRARGALRTVMQRYSPPFGKDDAAWDDWQQKSQRAVCLLMSAGLDLLNEQGGEHPPTE